MLEYARGDAHVNTCESFFALLAVAVGAELSRMAGIHSSEVEKISHGKYRIKQK